MKHAILNSLKAEPVVSGQALARKLGVSRAAVSKHIKQLRRQGYEISSAPRRGYTLESVPDRLLADEIRHGLKTRVLGQNIVSLEEITSTQDHAKELSLQGCPAGTVVVAETQTLGRGRIGRKWVSPEGGLYFSVLLRPAITMAEAAQIPLVAGVALARAMERHTFAAPRLKWPNDVLLRQRKTAGILAEIRGEMDFLDWLILGIGVNVAPSPSRFPPDIRQTSTSLSEGSGAAVNRLPLIRDILCNLENILEAYQAEGFQPFRDEWKRRSDTLGRKVRVSCGRQFLEGEAVDIDSEGALILDPGGGLTRRITGGDIFFMDKAHE
ncbi:MAG: biotin--[acetyl-CoA-carboxylase] ligase [Desulfosalsimonadaceae bacterium]